MTFKKKKNDLFFEKIFVISLPRRTDRRQSFFERMEAAKFPRKIEVWDACDGNETPVPDEWTCGAGAWGCFVSHRDIIQRGLAEGWKSVLIFEDDALPIDPATFVENLTKAVLELPEDWEQFYLGCQHFHQEAGLPEVYSEHLWRPFNANRTHAYALSAQGMKKVAELLDAWKSWPPKYHIDWAMGYLLHETKKIDVYSARPNLVGQAAGASDIFDRVEKERRWLATIETNRMVGAVKIEESRVGYGSLGLRGMLGVGAKKIHRPEDGQLWTMIGAHAPSELTVTVRKPILVYAGMDNRENAWEEIGASVDGEPLGTLRKAGSTTNALRIDPGKHVLKFDVADNRAAMTIWFFKEISE